MKHAENKYDKGRNKKDGRRQSLDGLYLPGSIHFLSNIVKFYS
ncbi:hypothetical protein SAMN04487995_4719 [Dyadobacter koreensis]|uniref:Uncharacterized protein n=1 Tax=Dyadobacter koreensis TaxID=408657 RepID=A0A1H6YQI3_9BACT|nr:hypothetical protein SAMN04487995_4719 [Dyadobacter koreensis]